MKKRRGSTAEADETQEGKELLRLSEYVKAICRCSEYGGRVVVVCSGDDDHEDDSIDISSSSSMKNSHVLLLDIGAWTDDMAMCVAHRFPGVQIEVQQSRCSLTGFCVAMTLFEQQQQQPGSRMGKGNTQMWSMWCMLILVVLFFCAMAAVFVAKRLTYFIDGIDFNF
jgi:hypothetical protein